MDQIIITRSLNIVLCLAGIVANLMALAAMKIALKNINLPKHRFLLSLNISDIMISLALLIIDIFILCDITWCNIVGLLHIIVFTGYTSLVCSLVCLAFDLYIAICFALRYNSIMTSRRVSVVLGVIWLWSIMIGMLLFVCRLVAMAKSDTDFCNAPSEMCPIFLGIFGIHVAICVGFLVFFHNRVQVAICRMQNNRPSKPNSFS